MDKKQIIFNCGSELFLSKGFKDTNISDIAKMAGIAVGTFYNYYPSKEKLFFEIYIKENEKLKKHILESLDMDQDPVTLVSQLVEQNIHAMNSNKILKEWYNRDLFQELERYYEEVKGDDDSIRNSSYAGLLKKWRAEGKIREDIDDDLLPAFFDSLVYIDTHKEEIGVRHFPQVIQYLAEFIMKGLTDHQK
ncbi:TetR/AcrR family transcriptional regulator [Paenibacillus sp.]|jgi:AcrR family transcriptional regulator|uniref:TetR/AcrR family transcriptional regulator n=1 Tax=Paenibacillus sp. TaxID=58172 RepID=UPI002834EDC3|nr:TetR/AcrR family transcriptional regulator [Paenibacillus sp.]MDR0266755.1 TetR/AcrR family transcriptional regulator [Paenibacillus sp.]